jgi:DNA (cytosine-5)-methyltransferase 1
LPDADLAWASFPCQDLSVAGQRAGLSGERSSAYWGFWKAMSALRSAGRRPKVIVLENVPGLLRGPSFAAICDSLAALGMRFGALVMDASRFVPQSRSRVFIVAADVDRDLGPLAGVASDPSWSAPALVRAASALSPKTAASWVWWRVPAPPGRSGGLDSALESHDEAHWWPDGRTQSFLRLMSPRHRKKLEDFGSRHSPAVGLAYKRTRHGRQCAEVRVDGLAGCLRAPRGGSSRQIVALMEAGRLRARLLSPREAARLMGVPDTYSLPPRYNDAYHAMGDGVVVPVVRWLTAHLLEPLSLD